MPVYKWDCVTMYPECFSCEHHHKMTEGEKPHECPFGKKQRLRRIGPL